MGSMRSVCVFCGSNPGRDPLYREAAQSLGRYLAGQGIGLVYGGGRVGLMGAVADAVLEAGGRVTGVIPRALAEKEIEHTGLSELHVVDSMHERKLTMANAADGFIALPGGVGTLEEIFEVITWTQLGIHVKPCGFLNVGGFFDPLLGFLRHMAAEQFLHGKHLEMIACESDAAVLLERMAAFTPPQVEKWVDRQVRP